MTSTFISDPQAGEFRSRLFAYLAEQTTMTLSGVTEDGAPHSCDLFYAHASDLAFYFLSDPKTQHAKNIERAPRVAATIHGASKGWEEIRGVQMDGMATRVAEPAERVSAFALYVGKYGFVKQWLADATMLGVMLKGLGVVELYKVSPRWLRFIDNSLGFGHKDEIVLPTSF